MTILFYLLILKYILSQDILENNFNNFNFNDNFNDNNGIWNNRILYYETNLSLTLSGILELNKQCIYNTKIISSGQIIIPSLSNEIYITEIKVNNDIIQEWKDMGRPTHMRSDPLLCDLDERKKKSFFNGTGCQVKGYMNQYAPRCQKSYLKWICDSSKSSIYEKNSKYFVVPESNHLLSSSLPPQPWLLTARNAFVSKCGVISYECGVAHSSASCFYQNARGGICPISLINQKDIRLFGSINISCPKRSFVHVEYHPKVFVVAEWDDSHIYHTELEVIPRILYHREFLISNPDIKILFGCNSMKSTPVNLVSVISYLTSIMNLAGISMDRFLFHTDVFSDEVYLPKYGGCQDPVYNTWELLSMRRFFYNQLKHSTLPELTSPPPNKPVILLMSRSAKAKFSRNKGDPVRLWSKAFINRFIEQLSTYFPNYEIKLFSDKDEKLMKCVLCQIKEFSEADILIGIHGAGFANQIFMKPNSVVLEICPYGNDGRCYLGGGPFSRAAFVMSHNYLVHHPPYEEFIWSKTDSEFNLSRLVEHLHSFLNGTIVNNNNNNNINK